MGAALWPQSFRELNNINVTTHFSAALFDDLFATRPAQSSVFSGVRSVSPLDRFGWHITEKRVMPKIITHRLCSILPIHSDK
jgi:hypothetical protein